MLKLVGGINRDPNGLVPFLVDLYPRLGSIKHTGSVNRHIGFENNGNDEDYELFFGMEVAEIEDIPEGMIAWELGEETLTVLDPKNGGEIETRKIDISWNWLDRQTPGRPIGEFIVRCDVETGQSSREFKVTTNYHVGIPEELDDDVHLVDYDPSWPEKYLEMESHLKELLEPVAIRIEHYGSTSIPGMPAKPVIDLLVEIPSFDMARRHSIPLLNKPEWGYCWYANHMLYVVRESLMGRRTHHIHMATKGHPIWVGLAFRDYLRANPEDASRYADLKYELAERYTSDREAYTNAKGAFVQEITEKALTNKT